MENHPRVHADFGLRYENVGPPTAKQASVDHPYGFDFNTGKQLFPSLGQFAIRIKPGQQGRRTRDWVLLIIRRGQHVEPSGRACFLF